MKFFRIEIERYFFYDYNNFVPNKHTINKLKIQWKLVGKLGSVLKGSPNTKRLFILFTFFI